MISFTCDYTEGAHPAILERLSATNFAQEPGYGEDRFTASACARIREALGCPEAAVFFLTGGTQTNSTVIAALLQGYEGAVAAETGHIAVHEAGAVEYTGHKVLTLPQHKGKMVAAELSAFLERFYADGAFDHMVFPGLVYLSFPTEYGTLYSKAELEAIHAVCRRFGLPLFVDGARLGYGLMSPSCDVSFPELAGLCDVFTIGGTKLGLLFGEADQKIPETGCSFYPRCPLADDSCRTSEMKLLPCGDRPGHAAACMKGFEGKGNLWESIS